MKKELQTLLDWAIAAKEVFKNAGESDFADLRKSEKKAIFNSLVNTGLDYTMDGDKYGAYLSVGVDDSEVMFTAKSESCYPDDMADHLSDMDITVLYGELSTNIDGLRVHIRNIGQTDIINLTPHAINVLDSNNEDLFTIPSSGTVARAEQMRTSTGDLNGVPVSKTSYGKTIDLPNEAAGVAYIVSALTAQAAPQRKDLYIVDDLVRDAKGQIIGCRAFAQI